jgi:hypothetical protein
MRTIVSMAAAASLFIGLAAASFAQPKPPPKRPEPPKCKACGMVLSEKKTDKMPRAVKIGGKTYYCCAGCKMEMPKK